MRDGFTDHVTNPANNNPDEIQQELNNKMGRIGRFFDENQAEIEQVLGRRDENYVSEHGWTRDGTLHG